jgi:hypothetical protein
MATPRLFETVFFILLPRSMNKVQRIARNPQLRNYVKTLVYIGDRLHNLYESLSEWTTCVTVFGTHDIDLEKYVRYCNDSRAQCQLLADGHERSFLSWTFRHLPRVVDFELASPGHLGVCLEQHAVDAAPILSDLSEATQLPMDQLFYDGEATSNMLLSALLHSLSSGYVSCNSHRLELPRSVVWLVTPYVQSALRIGCATMYAGVRSLYISLSLDDTVERDPDRVVRNGMRNFLAAFTNLTSVPRSTMQYSVYAPLSSTKSHKY